MTPRRRYPEVLVPGLTLELPNRLLGRDALSPQILDGTLPRSRNRVLDPVLAKSAPHRPQPSRSRIPELGLGLGLDLERVLVRASLHGRPT